MGNYKIWMDGSKYNKANIEAECLEEAVHKYGLTIKPQNVDYVHLYHLFIFDEKTKQIHTKFVNFEFTITLTNVDIKEWKL